jgi:chromosome segregation ATPase
MSTEDRVAQLESAFVTLTQLVQNHGDRFDAHMTWINELGETTTRLNASAARLNERMEELAAAQANSEGKIAALVDAQIRTEDELRRLAEAQRHSEVTAAEANARLDRLAVMVERLMEGRNGQG